MDVKWEGFLPIQGSIIIIEDDPSLRTLMGDIVTEVGASAILFDNADEALTYLLQSKDNCPLIIVDHGVPGQIQGIEFIEMVKSRWPSIEAILTSGYAISPDRIPPACIFLHKPWSLDDLVTAIAGLLQPGVKIAR